MSEINTDRLQEQIDRAESAETAELRRIKALRRRFLTEAGRPAGMTFKQWLVANNED